jgi:4-hydroxymandelate oxidase
MAQKVAFFAPGICSAISWEDVEWMSTQTELPLVLKGLGRAEDALRVADCPGVKAVICSNHGGRNLDGGPASADVLLQVMRHIDPVLHFRMRKRSFARTGSGQA